MVKHYLSGTVYLKVLDIICYAVKYQLLKNKNPLFFLINWYLVHEFRKSLGEGLAKEDGICQQKGHTTLESSCFDILSNKYNYLCVLVYFTCTSSNSLNIVLSNDLLKNENKQQNSRGENNRRLQLPSDVTD